MDSGDLVNVISSHLEADAFYYFEMNVLNIYWMDCRDILEKTFMFPHIGMK